MEILGDEWRMKGCAADSPARVRSAEELIALIERVGFLPLFSNAVPGFSVEEHCAADGWWTGDAARDPWEWRQILARDPRIAYGKFFDRKAGFISRDFFPRFANVRRDGYDFDALCDEGLASCRQQKLMAAFECGEDGAGKRLLSPVLRESAGFGRGGEKNFEGVLTDLQMKTYLILGDFRQRLNRRGEGYGWHLAELETPETKWGYAHVSSRYTESPGESREALTEHFVRLWPGASPADLKKLIG